MRSEQEELVLGGFLGDVCVVVRNVEREQNLFICSLKGHDNYFFNVSGKGISN